MTFAFPPACTQEVEVWLRLHRQGVSEEADLNRLLLGRLPGARWDQNQDSECNTAAREKDPYLRSCPHGFVRPLGREDEAIAIEGVRRIDDPSVSHRDDAVGMCGDIRRMRHHHDGHSRGAELLDQFEESAGRSRVEAPSGLVGQQNLRVVGQSTGYGDTLPLAAGQLRGQTTLTTRKVNLGQELASSEFPLTSRKVWCRTWASPRWRGR